MVVVLGRFYESPIPSAGLKIIDSAHAQAIFGPKFKGFLSLVPNLYQIRVDRPLPALLPTPLLKYVA